MYLISTNRYPKESVVFCKNNKVKSVGNTGYLKIPYAVFCIWFSLVMIAPSAAADSDNSLAARKSALIQRLDSIDLEKQLRKRKGEAMTDLEKVAETIKDSVAVLKKQMPKSNAVAGINPQMHASERQPFDVQAFLQKIRPKSMFDWMVIVIGFIAVVSGMVLLVGIFGLLTKGLRKKKKPALPPKTLQEIFPRSYASEAYGKIPKVQSGHAEEKEGAMEVLRKRIEKTPIRQTSEPRLEPVLETVHDAIEEPLTSQDNDDMKQRVMAAAREGCDVLEISRRLHISADQVSLILRMSKDNDR